MGDREAGILRLDFDRRLKLEFHGSKGILKKNPEGGRSTSYDFAEI